MAQHDKRNLYGTISAGVMSAVVISGLFAACNTNPVIFLSSTGAIQNKIETSVSKQSKMDILWVVDNSGSMCQEQKVLRDNFDDFVDVLKNTSLDFHLAVTTTHAPSADSGVVTELIAQEAHIQSTPQPIPGFDTSCVQSSDANNKYAPLRDALNGALDCLADDSKRAEFNWTDAQIDCALLGVPADCFVTLNIPDRNGDNFVSTEDLFPISSDYRPLPKVLKSEAYRQQDGSLDVPTLKRDFGCMSLVGTRGDGFERGLQAALKAVSPEFTGYSEGVEGADDTKPNHGFIRKDAGFTLVFVTDENDCSPKDGVSIPAVNDCEADLCDFENSTALSPEESRLKPVELMAQEFMENLSKTKGREVSQTELLMASIQGQSRPYTEALPTPGECKDLGKSGRDGLLTSCETRLGKARSGDRYERFIRQFQQYYPNDVTEKTPLDFTKFNTGWICNGDFAPALSAIAEFIKNVKPGCVTDNVMPCEQDTDCPAQLYSNAAGRCLEVGESKFCDSGIVLQISLDDEAGAQFPDINTNPYCMTESIGKLRTKTPSCLVKPELYSWQSCAATQGLSFEWMEDSPVVAQKLAGYKLELIYNATVDDPNAL